MQDTDERIIVHEVKLKELNRITISYLKNSSLCMKDIQMRAINAIADYVQSEFYTKFSLWKLLCLDLNKKEAIHVNRIINKYDDLFRLLDESLGYTDITELSQSTKDP